MSPSGKALCFVAMPFGIKRNHETGADCDFDAVYAQIIKPAVEKANLQCIRADEEKIGGIIHKPMYERLLLCDYAVADLSTANANVFYEVGIRHAFRPRTTVLTFAQGFRIPFDLEPVRGLPYGLDDAGRPSSAAADADALTAGLLAAQNDPTTDSPLFQLCDGLIEPDRSSLNVAAFNEQAARTEQLQRRIKAAANSGEAAVRAVDEELPENLEGVAPGVLIDLLVAYRNHEMYGDMVKLVEAMPEVVRTTPKVREQYALALNRTGDPDTAMQVIEELQQDRGHSSESWGILGRIYKDRWAGTTGRVGGALAAQGWLDQAINAYRKGFETDWRDHYPGINAVQLMWLKDRRGVEWTELLPVVRYSAMQAANSARPDYWAYATLMEAAIYRNDMNEALAWLTKAVTSRPDSMHATGTLESVERLRRVLDPNASDDQWNQIVEALKAIVTN
jgi:tetratricopeptide (TPR) repeat protein